MATVARFDSVSFDLDHTMERASRGSRSHQALLINWYCSPEGKRYHAEALENQRVIAKVLEGERRREAATKACLEIQRRQRQVVSMRRNGPSVGGGLSRFSGKNTSTSAK
jgi:hypothetical protein